MKAIAITVFLIHALLVAFLLWQPSRRLASANSDQRRDPLFTRLGTGLAYFALFAAQAEALASFLRGPQSRLDFAVGLALFGLGLGLRLWAIWTLGRYFTMEIGIRDGHRLISAGPYAWIRHPSYAGYLLIVAGMGIAYGSAIGFAVPVGLTTGFLALRIPQEEGMMRAHFGEAYREYSRKVKRLIPFVV